MNFLGIYMVSSKFQIVFLHPKQIVSAWPKTVIFS